MDADQLLAAGDLDGARSALVETVRSNPADERAGMFLFQLLAVAGEWEKARTHLEALARISAEARMLATVYSMAMKAEEQRAAIFAGNERMPVIRGAWAEGLADSIMHTSRPPSRRSRATTAAAVGRGPAPEHGPL